MKLLYDVHNKDAYSIIRLKKSNNFCKKLIKDNINDFIFDVCAKNNLPLKYRIIRYTIDSQDYFVGTTITDNLHIDTIKYLYNKRWKIETYFNNAKHINSLEYIHFKNMDSVKKVNIKTIYGPILNKLTKRKNDTITIIISDILAIMNLLVEQLIKIVGYRKYERIAIIPPTMWHFTKKKHRDK